MTERPMKMIVDLSKPKGQRQTVVEMTDEEIAQNEANDAIRQAERVEQAALEAEKAAAKESANDKLSALGLSPEEIAAITGA